MTAPATKPCECCDRPFSRRKTESRGDYLARRTCGKSCAARLREADKAGQRADEGASKRLAAVVGKWQTKTERR